MPFRILLLIASVVGWPLAVYLKNNFLGLFSEESFGIKYFAEKAKEEAKKPKEERMTAKEWEALFRTAKSAAETEKYNISADKPGNKLGQEF